MQIIDSQVHIWHDCQPNKNHRQILTYTKDDLLQEMDEAGVDAAILCPPTFCPKMNDMVADIVRQHPDRFAAWGFFPLDDPQSRETIKTWKNGQYMLGARFATNLPHQRGWWRDGTMDWLWPAAEELDIPIGLGAQGNIDVVAGIAERHPRLRLVLDHMNALSSERDNASFPEQDQLLALARFPNVACKVSGAPGYSTEPYPYRNIHPYIREIFEAFGRERTFWGTDITRMPCSYRECVTMFTENLDWLNGEDLEWVMGKGLCRWLDWKRPDLAD